MAGSEPELIGECADLLYHLLVLLRERSLPLDAVVAELARRHQQRSAGPDAIKPA